MGVTWLVAALVVCSAAVFIVVGRTWWAVATVTAVVSQVVIRTSWSDATADTAANLLLVFAIYGFASLGPHSYHAQWDRRTVEALVGVDARPPVVTEADLADLPGPLAAYVRRSGAVGRPRVTSFHADVNGRIRSRPDEAWMPFTGKQLNTLGPRSAAWDDIRNPRTPDPEDPGTITGLGRIAGVPPFPASDTPQLSRRNMRIGQHAGQVAWSDLWVNIRVVISCKPRLGSRRNQDPPYC